MYVDESGDVGMANSPTRYFVLSGLVLHELRWRDTLDQIIAFRKQMMTSYGLKFYEELHSAHLLAKPGALRRIPKHQRLAIIRHFANHLSTMPHLSVIGVVVDKQGKPANYDPFEMAWKALIQRFENTILHNNFPGPANPDDRGMLIPDNTDVKKLTSLLRRMRRFNPIPNQPAYGAGSRNLTLRNMVEDPVFRNSADSLLIQAADLCAFLLYQQEFPSAYMRKQGGRAYYQRLAPIHCTAATPRDPQGVVRL